MIKYCTKFSSKKHTNVRNKLKNRSRLILRISSISGSHDDEPLTIYKIDSSSKTNFVTTGAMSECISFVAHKKTKCLPVYGN